MNQRTSLKRVTVCSGFKAFLVGFLILFLGILGALQFYSSKIPVALAASNNNTVNFQARLQTSSGALVPDGYYNVEFKLYNASSVQAGQTQSAQGSCSGDANCLWVETRDDSGTDNRVRVVDGYLSVQLGSVNPFPSTINWNQPLWLTMNIGQTGTSPVWDGEMNPRIALTAVPSAMSAEQLQSVVSGYQEVLQFSNSPSSDITINIPKPDSGSTGTICLQNSTSCGFVSSGSLSSSAFVQNGNSFGTAALLGTNDNFGVNIETDGHTVESLSNTGQATFENNSNSSSAFQIQNASGSSGVIFNADTTTNTVTVSNLSDTGTSYVSGSSTIDGGLTVSNSASGDPAIKASSNDSLQNSPTTIIQNIGTGNATQEFAAGGSTFFEGVDTGSNGNFSLGNSVNLSNTVITGDTTIGSSQANNSQNVIYADKVTTGVTANASQSISIYIGAIDATSPGVQVAIYSDSSGSPGTLLASSSTYTPTSIGWQTIPISTSLAPSTNYWIAFNLAGANTQLNWSGATANALIYMLQPFGTWPSSPPSGSWTNTGSYNTDGLSLYMTYATAAPADDLANSLLSISTTGQTTFQNGTDSTNALSIKDASGNVVVNVDTTNGQVTTSTNNGLQDSAASVIQNTGSGNVIQEFSGSGSAFFEGIDTGNGNSFSINSGSTTSSASATLGSTDTGTGSGPCYNNMCASKVTTGSVATTATSISAYISWVDSAAPNGEVAIYTDNSGVPGTFVTNSAALSLTPGWDTFTISASLSANTSYWIVYNEQGGSHIGFSAGGNFEDLNQTYGTWPSSPTGWGNVGDTLSMYMTIGGSNDFADSLFTLGPAGAAKFQNSTDSTTAFQIQDAGSVSVLTADTTTDTVTVKNLAVSGDVNFNAGSNFSTTGTSNNVNFGSGSLFRLTGSSTQTITGVAGGSNGREITLINAASQAAVLKNDDTADSSATNVIITGTGADFSIGAGSSITMVYDGTSDVWRLIGAVAGATGGGSYVSLQTGTPTPDTGSFDVSGSGTVGGGLTVSNSTSGDPAISASSNDSLQNSPIAVIQNVGTGNVTQEFSAVGDNYFLGVNSTNSTFNINSEAAANTGNIATLGYATIGSSSSTMPGWIAASEVTTGSAASSSDSISLYIGGVDSSNPGVQVAIYSNNSGSPGTLMASSSTTNPTVSGWLTIPISVALSPSTSYWIAFEFQGNDYANTQYGVGNFDYLTGETYGTWPSPSSGWTSANSSLSMYMTYTTSGISNDYTNSLFSMTDTGQATFENSTNSTSAFEIQNAGGAAMLTVNTTTGTVTVGNGSNTITLSTASGISASGTAQHAKKITLAPEYAGAVLDNNGASSDVGSMTAGFDSTAKEGYYDWTTTQTSAQTYDVVITIGLPSDWSSWASSNALTLQTWSDNTTNSTGTITVTGTTGTTDISGSSLTPGSASTWTTKSFNLTNADDAANGVMVIRIHMSSNSGSNFRAGNLTLTYNSAF